MAIVYPIVYPMTGYLDAVDSDIAVVITIECEPETHVLLHPGYGSKSPYFRLKFDGKLGEERER